MQICNLRKGLNKISSKGRMLVGVVLLSALPVFAMAQTQQFTPKEQQSVSVETPGLFERSEAFTVDFGQMSQSDYSFPLPVGKVEGIHKNNNIMITSSPGDNVKAMFAGTVRLSRNSQQFGNIIVLRHDNGLETVYGNNAQNLVRVGDRVKAGQTIAIIGERDDKTYCEFAIMVNGARLNPEMLLELKSHRLRHQTLLFQKHASGVIIKVVKEEKEQTLKRTGQRHGQRGNMTKTSNRTVQDETSASGKYTKNSEHVVVTQVDDEPYDIDEYQALQLEEKVKKLSASVKEFTVNFAALKENGDWSYPMTGGHVISPYGGKRRHAGTDIKTKAGDPVYAAFDGQVVLSGTHFGYGLCIVIRHSNGFETLYSHQKKNSVKVGDWVKAGQQIGIVGRSGRATTEHCHFEVRANGRPFDSSKIFDHSKNQLRSVVMNYRNGRVFISNPSSAGAVEEESAVYSKSKGGKKTSARKKSASKKSKKKRRR